MYMNQNTPSDIYTKFSTQHRHVIMHAHTRTPTHPHTVTSQTANISTVQRLQFIFQHNAQVT